MTSYIFIHQNFPGQFRHIAIALARNTNNQVIAITDEENTNVKKILHPQIKILLHKSPKKIKRETHPYLQDHESHVRRGQSVARVLISLRDNGLIPDVVVCHPGWGEGLFVKDIFPKAFLINYCEYYYQGGEGDSGFDPEFPQTLDDLARLRIKNNTLLQSLMACDRGFSPTNWQKTRHPIELQSKITVMHEGIDTSFIKPNSDASLEIEIGVHKFKASDEIVTFVSRNLEPYRGFHTLIRSLPLLQKLRPNSKIIIVGGDSVSYGRSPPEGNTYREIYRAEVANQVDWSRVFFVGRIPYSIYLKVLQISSVHVYLTYPFVLSWSMLEAMASGCLVVASRTPPVEEVIEDGANGVLFDFFDYQALATRLAEILKEPNKFQAIRLAARNTIIDKFDLNSISLPKWMNIIGRP